MKDSACRMNAYAVVLTWPTLEASPTILLLRGGGRIVSDRNFRMKRVGAT